MEELKRLLEEQGKAFEAFKIVNDARLKAIEARGFAPAEVEAKVTEINAEMNKLSAEIGELTKKLNRPGASGGMSAEQAEHRAAFETFFRKGIDNGLRDLERQANLSTLSDPDGGFLVPEEMEQAIDRVTGTVSAMRSICTVRTIGTDTYKKLVNQGGVTSGWVGEKASRPETSTPTLREIAINTKELYANPAATQTLLDDSRVDIAAWLADEVSVEFAEEEGEAFISGNGVEEPKGLNAYTKIANASYAWGNIGYIAGGHASLLNNLDKLIDLQHALKPAYRNQARWLMNDSTALVIRKFKDGEGNYLWRPGLVEGQPDTLLAKPISYDDNVDSITTNTYPIYYGNFARAYLIVDRFGIRVLRDPYTNKPYVHFYTTKRVGGGITLYEAIKTLKIAVS